jgi:hypothetical protein
MERSGCYSVEDFCAAHNISRPTLTRLFSEGRGPEFFKIGRRIFIPVEAAARWRTAMAEGQRANKVESVAA